MTGDGDHKSLITSINAKIIKKILHQLGALCKFFDHL